MEVVLRMGLGSGKLKMSGIDIAGVIRSGRELR